MTDDDRRMLDLAGQRWNYAGSLEQTVRDEFGVSLTRFYQRVNQLIDTEEALAYDPVVVNRLRRLRTRRL
ncbi:helix-turn-helix DNA-binding domain protein [Gordonia phage Leroy]|nr:helix-turn-helix DNA-binding domain protein [Gordonia phage Leroy]